MGVGEAVALFPFERDLVNLTSSRFHYQKHWRGWAPLEKGDSYCSLLSFFFELRGVSRLTQDHRHHGCRGCHFTDGKAEIQR